MAKSLETVAEEAQGRLQQLFPEVKVEVQVLSQQSGVHRLRITSKEKDLDAQASILLKNGMQPMEMLVEVIYGLIKLLRLPPLGIEEDLVECGIAYCRGHVDKERFVAELERDGFEGYTIESVRHDYMRQEFHGTPREPFWQFHGEKVRGGTPVTVVYLDE